MLQTQLFTKTRKEISADEKSLNARLLIKSGYIDKLMAGVFTYLPLGLRVLKKIENIVREEINLIGGQEILMPALTPKEYWDQTGRWQNFDALFKLRGIDSREYALGATHEEIISPLLKKFILSYKDLPLYVYQIQDKFRNEPRAKSGLLRGREFLMKDLYSFHSDDEDLDTYYYKSLKAYKKIFDRCGIGSKTFVTLASGGSFSKYSHEFQTVTEFGEDTIFLCTKCKEAINKELFSELNRCQICGNDRLEEKKSIEVGNIFKLGVKYSTPFNLNFVDKDGREKPVVMGCYGIGIGRLMGTIAEVWHDENGLVWPEAVAPFKVHLLLLGSDKDVKKSAEAVYKKLVEENIEVLFDDRDVSAGEKLNDADLLGIPQRAVISKKTGGKVALKARNEKKEKIVKISELIKIYKDNV
ncbi:hypothetical protein C4569_00170 [Candidatus Parcubacteria bacterium]|nr:MAG: hypothetical protein C4569_00170 [Candidatus Parcubacteria bacterium]